MACLVILLACAALAAAQQPVSNYTILMGAQLGNAIFNEVFPSAITIHTGDSVTFAANNGDFATATFLTGLPASQQPKPATVIPCPPPINVTYPGEACMCRLLGFC
jgi:hypothetical protein